MKTLIISVVALVLMSLSSAFAAEPGHVTAPFSQIAAADPGHVTTGSIFPGSSLMA
jgi:hypothetical protein